MKREFLKDLGLEDDVIEKIMAETGKERGTLQSKIDDLQEKVNSRDETIKSKNQEISELKKVDIEAVKKEQFELGKAEGSKEVEDFKRQSAIDKIYEQEFEIDGQKYKVKDKKALQGYLDNEKIKYENNEVSGLVEQFTEIVKTSPYLFETDKKNPQFADTTQGVQGSKEITKKDFAKMSYRDRLKIYNENKALYDQLVKE